MKKKNEINYKAKLKLKTKVVKQVSTLTVCMLFDVFKLIINLESTAVFCIYMYIYKIKVLSKNYSGFLVYPIAAKNTYVFLLISE